MCCLASSVPEDPKDATIQYLTKIAAEFLGGCFSCCFDFVSLVISFYAGMCGVRVCVYIEKYNIYIYTH